MICALGPVTYLREAMMLGIERKERDEANDMVTLLQEKLNNSSLSFSSVARDDKNSC